MSRKLLIVTSQTYLINLKHFLKLNLKHLLFIITFNIELNIYSTDSSVKSYLSFL